MTAVPADGAQVKALHQDIAQDLRAAEAKSGRDYGVGMSVAGLHKNN